MAELFRLQPNDAPAFLRAMSVYFAEFDPGEANMYRQLVAALQPRHSCITLASLNYDLLLEISITRNGQLVSYKAPPIQPNNVSVLKLHGSCNFLPIAAVHGLGFEDFVGPTEVKDSWVDAPIRIGSPDDVAEFCRSNDTLAPAIAMYAKRKRMLFSGAFVEAQQRQWREVAARARNIFVVGVRLHEVDDHVWGPLRTTVASVFHVGPERGVFEAWRAKCRRKNRFHLCDRFEDALSGIKRILSV